MYFELGEYGPLANLICIIGLSCLKIIKKIVR